MNENELNTLRLALSGLFILASAYAYMQGMPQVAAGLTYLGGLSTPIKPIVQPVIKTIVPVLAKVV